MKVAVVGPSGMLGRCVVDLLKEEAVPIYQRRINDIIREIRENECDGIINCAGVIPLKNNTAIDLIHANSLLPHVLAGLGLRTVLVSTDCVFSGRTTTRYIVNSLPDARDYYGKSKALGEVIAPNVCVVRTSFIGCDHGLMSWVLTAGLMAKSTGEEISIDGWKNAKWTGSTVTCVANALINIFRDPQLVGVQHLATERVINKFDLLIKLIEINDIHGVVVKPAYFPVFNRALQPTITLPDIDTALRDFPCRQVARMEVNASDSLVNV